MSIKQRFTLCCIIDQYPRFYVELVLWVLCAKRYLPLHQFQIVVYFVGVAPHDLRDWLKTQSVDIRQIDTVIDGSPHCNKIAPFNETHATDTIIVCDADLFFVDDPSCLLASNRFRAAPNNHCAPPPAIFKAILAASGLEQCYRPSMAVCQGEGSTMRETHINNICASITVMPQQRAQAFVSLWKKWALWLVKNRALMDRWAVHVDQVAFALAMEEMEEDVEFLPPQTNVILHILPEIATVYAFHLSTGHIPNFAQRFNTDHTLNPEGLDEGVVNAIHRLNSCIREAVKVIQELPSTKEHLHTFLNPQWNRDSTGKQAGLSLLERTYAAIKKKIKV